MYSTFCVRVLCTCTCGYSFPYMVMFIFMNIIIVLYGWLIAQSIVHSQALETSVRTNIFNSPMSSPTTIFNFHLFLFPQINSVASD